MPRPPDESRAPSRRNHSHDIWACDFLQLYDVLFRPLFAFFFVVHGTREVDHFNVTRCPTDAWAAQQLREATPSGDGPKYLIRDNAHVVYPTLHTGIEFGEADAAYQAPDWVLIWERPPL